MLISLYNRSNWERTIKSIIHITNMGTSPDLYKGYNTKLVAIIGPRVGQFGDRCVLAHAGYF